MTVYLSSQKRHWKVICPKCKTTARVFFREYHKLHFRCSKCKTNFDFDAVELTERTHDIEWQLVKVDKRD